MENTANAAMRVIGIMSGTSVDAIDVALCEFIPQPYGQPCTLGMRLLGYREQPFPDFLRQLVLSTVRHDICSLPDLTELNFLLGEALATAALQTLQELNVNPADIDLVASHGQTIFHLVEPDRINATLQMGEAAVIARCTGISTVSDFRVADMAAGGQGAPLVSFLDALLFSDEKFTRALQNIGGIANVTFLPAASGIDGAYAFDTGPGNALIDFAARHFSHETLQYDRDGAMALAGHVDDKLLNSLLAHTYFQRQPPKTTGRELFGDSFALEVIASDPFHNLSPSDIMATLTAFTAESIARAYRDFGPPHIDEMIVSGGGARNLVLMEFLQQALPGIFIMPCDGTLLPGSIKEAVAFALLGYETIHGRPANLPRCTGAAEPAILGKITPGLNFSSLLSRLTTSDSLHHIGKEQHTCRQTQKLYLVP